MSSFDDCIIEFLKKNNIINSTNSVLVAFSGGIDSMCLLHWLNANTKLNLVAIHLNHNWRGEESKKEENNCRKFCEKYNIPFYCELLNPNVAKTETAAREARYNFFKKCAEKFNSNVVLTAHNANDNAETLLYRLAKGTAVDGLTGIAEKRDIFYRPLLKIERDIIEKYCKIYKLNPNVDSSNENTLYKRNLIRHKIIPELKVINPDVISAINSLSEVASVDCNYLNKLSNEIENSTQKFLQADISIKNRVVKNLLIKNSIDYDRTKIEQLVSEIKDFAKYKSGKTISLSSSKFLFVNSEKFIVISSYNKLLNTEINITNEGEYAFENDFVFSIKKISGIPDKFPKDKENIAYVNLDNINFVLRHRKNGDYICPIGLNGTQKIKKYLNEKKIPQHEKDNIVLLCSGKEVLWAVGLGISDKIKVCDKPTHILKFFKKKG